MHGPFLRRSLSGSRSTEPENTHLGRLHAGLHNSDIPTALYAMNAVFKVPAPDMFLGGALSPMSTFVAYRTTASCQGSPR